MLAWPGTKKESPKELSLPEGPILIHLAGSLTQGWDQLIWGTVERLLAAGVPATPDAARARQPETHRRYNRLGASQVAALVADYESGISMVDVGRKYQVSDETVARWLKVNGVTARKRNSLPADKLPEARSLRAQGWSYRQIGNRYGCSRQTVINTLRRKGDLE